MAQKSEESSSREPWRLSTYLGDALLTAVSYGQVEVASALLSYGADKDTSDENGVTLLMHAARQGHVITATHLMELDADIDARTRKGKTALHLAALGGRLQMVEKLLGEGAKFNVGDVKGVTR